MAQYIYTFLTGAQRKVKGVIEAADLKEAKEKLAKQGIPYLSVKDQKFSFFRKKPSKKDVIQFSYQLALLLRSGLPLYESLLSIEDRYKGSVMGRILTVFSEKIREGASLSEVMQLYPEVFDDFYQGNVLVGESSGSLESVLTRLAEALEKKNKFRNSLVSALLYPLILTVFSLAVIFFFLLGVVPSLREVIDEGSQNGLTRIVFKVSQILCLHSGELAIVLVSIITSLIVLKKKLPTIVIIEKIFKSVSCVRNLFVKSCLGEFFLLVSTMLKGGGALIRGLEIGSRAIVFQTIRHDFQEIITEIIAGSTLSRSLEKREWAPKLVVHMVALGEETGELADILGYLGELYIEDTRKVLGLVSTWSQPVILVVLGGIIGLIMLAVLVPLTGGVSIQ